MKKLILLITLITIATNAQVGIGTTNPDGSAKLDVTATDKGVLIPRVSLTDVTNIITPVNGPAEGLMVYNTNTSVTGGNGAGFYFFNGTSWKKITSTDDTSSTNLKDIGVISAFPGVTYPNDMYLPISGGTFNDVDYPEFANFISNLDSDIVTNNGNGTFTLANWNNNGVFLRGVGGHAGSLGILQNDATALPNSSFSTLTRNLSTFNAGSHRHTLRAPYNDFNNSTSQGFPLGNNHQSVRTSNRFGDSSVSQNAVSPNGNHTHNLTIPSLVITGGDIETRPINRAITWVIKVKPSASSVSNLTINNITDIGTDDQNLLLPTLTGTTLNLNIENGTSTSIDLAPIQDGIGTDDQNLLSPTLTGTTLNLNIENGTSTSIDLAPLQDGIGTDDQNLLLPTLTGTTLNLNIENGTGTNIDLASLQDGNSQNTLDQAYDEGGLGNGRSITVDNGVLNFSGTSEILNISSSNINTNGKKSMTISSIVNSQDNRALDITLLGTNPTTSPQFGISNSIKNTIRHSTTRGLTSGLYNSFILGTNSGNSLLSGYVGIFNSFYSINNNNGTNTGTKNDFINSSARQIGIDNYFLGSAPSGSYGLFNHTTNINNTTDSELQGVYNIFENNSISNKNTYGTHNILSGSSTGDKYGTFTEIDELSNGLHYGIYSKVLKNTGFAGYFLGRVSIGATNNLNSYILPLTRGLNNQIMQLNASGQLNFVDPSSLSIINASNGLNSVSGTVKLGGNLTEDTNINYGNFDTRFNLNGTGDFIIQDNGVGQFEINDTGAATFGDDTTWRDINTTGTILAKLYDSGVDGVFDVYQAGSVKNRIHGNGNSFFNGGDVGFGKTNPAYQVDISETDTSKARALSISKSNTANSDSWAIYNTTTGTGTGKKYGTFNQINSNANGNQYGTRNWLRGSSGSSLFGTFNNISSGGFGDHYGIYNAMRGGNATNRYAVWNEFNVNSVANETTGVRNTFSLGIPGAGGHNGIYNYFTNSATGNYYGSRTEYTNNATGIGNKYGTYNFISSGANGIHYGTYNNVSTTKGWAGYFLGKNYISNRLSIGETDNANAKLNIRANSGNTISHIELEETGSTDGARIRFTNPSTTNKWTVFGKANNNSSSSFFNIHYTGIGNIINVRGNGIVGIKRAPTTYSFEVNGNASKSTSGSWLANSDRRLKKNIIKIKGNNALKKITKMRGVTYEWNDDKTGIERPKSIQYGFIAQELMEVFPTKVFKDNLGYYQTAYGDYDAIFVEAIKELNSKIENLEVENKNLKVKLSKIDALEARLNELENNQSVSEFSEINKN